MKLFEIVMSVVAVALVLGYVSGMLAKGRRMYGTLAAGAAALGLHAAIEGFRVQMLLMYLFFIVCFVVYGIDAAFGKSADSQRKPKPWKRIVFGFVGTITLAAALAVPLYFLPTVKLAKPTGPYAIGTTDYYWLDKNRAEPFTSDANDRRELSVRAWYPAELQDDIERAPYAYDSEQMKRIGKEQPLYRKALLSSIANAKTHSYKRVPVSPDKQQYPVLLLSPGYGASHFMYTSFAENLASHGYIVFALEHPYYTILPTVFQDGRMTKGQIEFSKTLDWDSMREPVRQWVEDVRFAVDQLDELNDIDQLGILSGKMDLDRLGILGHSLGGAVAAQAMSQDNRIIAGINMDGFPYGDCIEEGLPHPFLYMITPDTDDFGKMELPEDLSSDPEKYGVTSAEHYRETAAELNRRKQGILRNGGTEWIASGSDHLSFSDANLYSPMIGSSDRTLLAQINERLLQFFDEHVNRTN